MRCPCCAEYVEDRVLVCPHCRGLVPIANMFWHWRITVSEAFGFLLALLLTFGYLATGR